VIVAQNIDTFVVLYQRTKGPRHGKLVTRVTKSNRAPGLCGPDLRLWIWHGRRGFDEFLGSRNRETAEKADFLDVDQQTAYVLWQHDFSRKFVLGIFDPNQKLQSQRACRFVVNNLFADADADDV
jgi:hypothetical protein